ncbi:hypothetical protein H696_04592 [Fonticula alba]|uniref:Uncharacterized protein n=1 Tax=Fonticula alba TaxID=691883 RepID=A0A058Z4I2_FONAL|nr:hypothetical protein H696_04592 [Fonticula alba]KCV69180.1 hypothetical protein H696_04592 [Fonticula alba]|eukprot:XP_009496751.1 hypothetical protein H696_04592 [Fonticula alba]
MFRAFLQYSRPRVAQLQHVHLGLSGGLSTPAGAPVGLVQPVLARIGASMGDQSLLTRFGPGRALYSSLPQSAKVEPQAAGATRRTPHQGSQQHHHDRRSQPVNRPAGRSDSGGSPDTGRPRHRPNHTRHNKQRHPSPAGGTSAAAGSSAEPGSGVVAGSNPGAGNAPSGTNAHGNRSRHTSGSTPARQSQHPRRSDGQHARSSTGAPSHHPNHAKTNQAKSNQAKDSTNNSSSASSSNNNSSTSSSSTSSSSTSSTSSSTSSSSSGNSNNKNTAGAVSSSHSAASKPEPQTVGKSPVSAVANSNAPNAGKPDAPARDPSRAKHPHHSTLRRRPRHNHPAGAPAHQASRSRSNPSNPQSGTSSDTVTKATVSAAARESNSSTGTPSPKKHESAARAQSAPQRAGSAPKSPRTHAFINTSSSTKSSSSATAPVSTGGAAAPAPAPIEGEGVLFKRVPAQAPWMGLGHQGTTQAAWSSAVVSRQEDAGRPHKKKKSLGELASAGPWFLPEGSAIELLTASEAIPTVENDPALIDASVAFIESISLDNLPPEVVKYFDGEEHVRELLADDAGRARVARVAEMFAASNGLQYLAADKFQMGHLDLPKGGDIPVLNPALSHVIHEPGVHVVRDFQSKTMHLPPEVRSLEKVKAETLRRMKLNQLIEMKGFKTGLSFTPSSKDKTLERFAVEQGVRFIGSTSSVSASLSHIYFTMSSNRFITPPPLISKSISQETRRFTRATRQPVLVNLVRKETGVYAVDSSAILSTESILSRMGHVFEKFLTSTTPEFEDFLDWHLTHDSAVDLDSREDRTTPVDLAPPHPSDVHSAYNYFGAGSLLLRSQLDCHDPENPERIFDLKTRATLAIRNFVKDYENNVKYRLHRMSGQLSSFEREYYDMIRSAFMKYSLQVRIGGMEGVMVAYHNTDEAFGFQFIPLRDMEQALYGNADLGDLVFRRGLAIFEQLLERISADFPGQSVALMINSQIRPGHLEILAAGGGADERSDEFSGDGLSHRMVEKLLHHCAPTLSPERQAALQEAVAASSKPSASVSWCSRPVEPVAAKFVAQDHSNLQFKLYSVQMESFLDGASIGANIPPSTSTQPFTGQWDLFFGIHERTPADALRSHFHAFVKNVSMSRDAGLFFRSLEAQQIPDDIWNSDIPVACISNDPNAPGSSFVHRNKNFLKGNGARWQGSRRPDRRTKVFAPPGLEGKARIKSVDQFRDSLSSVRMARNAEGTSPADASAAAAAAAALATAVATATAATSAAASIPPAAPVAVAAHSS